VRWLTVLIGLALVALAGCGSVPMVGKQKRENSLEASLAAYQKLIRWAYFDEAARYLRAADGKPLPADLGRVSRYRVTAYNVVDQLLADNGKEARVVAMIDYYEIDAGVLHTLRDEQYWWFDDAEKRWFLGSSLPAFGLATAR
jgi:hypothetical protein